MITKNTKLNNLSNVKIYNNAVSDTNEAVAIPLLEQPDPGIRIGSIKSKSHREVTALTIDEFVKNEKVVPNFVKIDVEGAEYKVLKGMQTLLETEDLTLLVEIHVGQLRKYFDTDYKEVLKFLSDHGFGLEIVEFYKSNIENQRKIAFTDHLEGNVMILCKK